MRWAWLLAGVAMSSVLTLADHARADSCHTDTGCQEVARVECADAEVPQCAMCEENHCLGATCRRLCDPTECPATLDLLGASRTMPAWTVSSGSTPCIFSVCPDVAPLDITSSAPHPCLSSVTTDGLAERFRRGDCDGDGIPNASEFRDQSTNFACIADRSPTIAVARADVGAEQHVRVLSSERCTGDSDCDVQSCALAPCTMVSCADSICTDADYFTIEVCVPGLTPTAGESYCATGDAFCLSSADAPNLPETDDVPPRPVPGMCLPVSVAHVYDCLRDAYLRCPDRTSTTPARNLEELFANGDCDDDGVPNSGEDALSGRNLTCSYSGFVWALDASGQRVRIHVPWAQRPTDQCPVDHDRLTISPNSLTVCQPNGYTVLAATRPSPFPRGAPEACSSTADATICIAGSTEAGRLCALAQLASGVGVPSCFRAPLVDAGIDSLSTMFANGDCDGDGLLNAMDMDTICGDGDAGMDATVDPLDVGVSDAGRRFDAGLAPDADLESVAYGGGACAATPRSPRDAAWVFALVALIVRRRRR